MMIASKAEQLWIMIIDIYTLLTMPFDLNDIKIHFIKMWGKNHVAIASWLLQRIAIILNVVVIWHYHFNGGSVINLHVAACTV